MKLYSDELELYKLCNEIANFQIVSLFVLLTSTLTLDLTALVAGHL